MEVFVIVKRQHIILEAEGPDEDRLMGRPRGKGNKDKSRATEPDTQTK